MFLNPQRLAPAWGVRIFRVWLALCMLTVLSAPVWAQVADSPSSSSSSDSFSIATHECKPNTCFASVQARKDYAKANSCYFLEDVCDTQGSKGKEQGTFAAAKAFADGLIAGLGDQIGELLEMLGSPVETAQAAFELAKAFYDDPVGTAKALASLAGEGINNLMIQATQCGAYDLGKVIGQNVSPVVALKVGVRLARFGGKIEDAVHATKLEVGCASFVAGTPVQLDKDLGLQASVVPIERIVIGQSVLSRDDKLWKDESQRVENTFGRVAPGYWELQTEQELYRLTEEHPVWVQGKGWTETKNVREDDVLATASGDALVRSNTGVNQVTRVYNFSVTNTPNYFVGEFGLWVHNAKCDLPSKYPDSKTTEFEAALVKLPPGERVAKIKEAAVEVASSFGWIRDKRVERLNPGRTVYADSHGNLYSLDTQHGRWEKVDAKTGKHISEVHLYQPDRYVPDSQRDDHGLKVK